MNRLLRRENVHVIYKTSVTVAVGICSVVSSCGVFLWSFILPTVYQSETGRNLAVIAVPDLGHFIKSGSKVPGSACGSSLGQGYFEVLAGQRSLHGWSGWVGTSHQKYCLPMWGWAWAWYCPVWMGLNHHFGMCKRCGLALTMVMTAGIE